MYQSILKQTRLGVKHYVNLMGIRLFKVELDVRPKTQH